MRDILDVIKNVESIYSANSSLSTLKDFERVLDEMDMYVYKNWQDGELAEGPLVERHWIKASFMWPMEKMPDPMAAKRLLDYGCKVRYERTHLLEPREVKTHDDLRPGTQKGKLDRNPVWGSTEGKQAAPAETADEMTAQAGTGAPAGAAAPMAGAMPMAPGA